MNRLPLIAALLLAPAFALAQTPDLNAILPQGASASGRVIQLVLLITVLSIAPGLLITITSFTRFAIALSFLRSGLGVQSTPANMVVISLALFMTFFVMTPTFNKAWENGVKPLVENKIGEMEAFERISDPFKEFMLDHVREKDVRLFEELSRQPAPATKREEISLQVLIPAFMISELRRGFEIGFLIVLPFLVIDMIVSIIIMSMGMMMLPPTTISLPIKILFFVLVDGWNLLVGSLLRSYS
jgi:flagellar biosynthesis protein FliP